MRTSRSQYFVSRVRSRRYVGAAVISSDSPCTACGRCDRAANPRRHVSTAQRDCSVWNAVPRYTSRRVGAGLRQQFISDHVSEGSDGQVRSVAGRFGVVAAAGELATEWGILPWETGEATQAAAICFRAWLDQRGGIGSGEVQAGIRQVQAFFEQHGTSRFPEIGDELRTINRCSWRRRDGEGWEFLVLPEAWRTEVCRGIDSEMTAKALAARELLKREGRI